MKIDVPIEDMLADAIGKAFDQERLQEMVEKSVTALVNDVIKNETREYSKFGGVIRKAIQESLPQAIEIQNQSAFRDSIMKIISGRISAYKDDVLEKQMNSTISSLLESPPESILLSELVQKAVSMWKSESYIRQNSARPTVIVARSDGIVDGYYNIFLDPAAGTEKYACRCSIAITDGGEAYSIRVDGKETSKSLFVGPLYDFDRYLFWLYTGGTKIVVDKEYFDDLDYGDGDESYDE